MAETLFGENIGLDNYDKDVSKDFVMKGMTDWLNPQLQKAKGGLDRRGFGRYSAPTIEGQVYNPLLETGAKNVRSGLTDLFYKDASEDRAERSLTSNLANASLDRKYKKKQMKGAGGTVLCTAYYRLGWLKLSDMKVDVRYMFDHLSIEDHRNYLSWARRVVPYVMENVFVRFALFPIVKLWSRYTKAVVNKTRRPVLGFIINYVGTKFGALLWNINNKREMV